MKKEKIIVSLIIMLLVFAFCNVSVFADNNVVTITANTSSTNNTTNNTSNNATNNTVNTTNNAVNNTNSTSTYNNTSTNTDDELPYTGTSYTIVFVIIAFVISAIYAYKKVTDYNV